MMAADLDETLCKQMSSLVELLTTSGKPTLNPEIMKKFKKLCRTSDLYVEHAFMLLMSQLEVDHAEVRLSTYQIIEELFMRSHMFRELILADFDTFLELTTGTDKKKPLPLPKAVAQNMKNSVFKSVQIWYDKFGAAYKKLELGYEFLKSFQKVDFDSIQADLELDRRQREENERKLEEARTEKLRKIDQEIMESEVEMQLSLTEVENGIQLLLPHPDDFFIPVQDEPGFSQGSNECSSYDGNFMKDTKEEYSNINLSSDGKCNDKGGMWENSCDCKTVEGDLHRAKHKQSCSPSATGSQSSTDDRDKFYSGIDQTYTAADTVDKSEADDSDNDNEMEDVGEGTADFNKEHGILDPTFSLTVTVGPAGTNLQETEDNTDLIQGVRDQYRLIKTKYMPLVKKWIQVLEDNNAKEQKKMLVAELKSKLEEAMKKCVELEISSFSHRKHQESDSDDDDDFEDVPDKEGYEDDIPEHVKLEAEMASTSKTSKKSSKAKSEKKPKRKKKPMNASTKKIKQMASELVMSQRLLAEDDIDSAMLRSKQHKSAQHCLQVDHKSVQDLPLFHPSEQTSSKSYKNTKHQGKQANLATSSSPCSSRSNDSSLKTNSHKDTPGCSESKRSDTIAVTDNNGEDDSTRKCSLLEKAPVVSYGIDIEHWERPGDIKAPVKNKFDASRFWVAEKDELETAGCSEEVASLTRRTMTYVGEFEAVKWKCRAPVGNEKLCERMDRVKCPFHGKVIGRDENGMPTNPEDFSMNNKSAVSSDSDTTSSKGKGKGKSSKKGKGKEKKGKYANLTDIREKHDAGRKRLEAKIFNKSTLRRVNKVLDNATMKKLSEKFGNQFNYSLK